MKMNKKYSKVQSTRRSLWMSILSLVLCFTMLLGTTWAWFTDEVTSGTNKIVAGNLDIEVSYKNGDEWTSIENVGSLFTSNLWEPGHTEYVNLKIENKGTLALKYQMMVSPISESGGVNKAGKPFKLSDYLMFGTAASTEAGFANRAAARDAVTATAIGLNQAGLTKTGEMQPKCAAQYVTLVVYMPETVGNEANYKTGTTAPEIDLGIKVLATQLTSEKDSFDNQYDANADFPALDKVLTYNFFPQVSYVAQLRKTEENKATKDGEDSQVTEDNDKITITSEEKAESNPYAKVTFGNDAVASFDQNGKAAVKLEAKKVSEGNFTVDDKDVEQVTFDIKVAATTGTMKANALYTVELFVGAGKQNVTMKHGETVMTKDTGTETPTVADHFIYDAVGGYVVMAVDHFSEFTAQCNAPVAAVDTTAFYSVAEAAKNVESGKTIVMLRDTEEEQQIVLGVGKNVAIDLNGKNISSAAPIENNGTLQIKDSGSEGKVEAQITNKGNLKIEDGEFTKQITNAEGAKTEATGGEFAANVLPEGSVPEGKKQDESGKIVECKHENLPADYQFNGTEHWKVCSECKAKVNVAAHDDKGTDGVCSKCGYQKNVADVAGVKYTDLQTAVNAAQSGDTVKLLKDYVVDITGVSYWGYKYSGIAVEGKENVTIDFNGYTVTGSLVIGGHISSSVDSSTPSGHRASYEKTTASTGIVLKDSSGTNKGGLSYGDTSGDSGTITVYDDSTVTIEGGKYECTYAGLTKSDGSIANSGQAYVVYVRGGNLTVNDGIFLNNSSVGRSNHVIDFWEYTPATVTVNGGVFKTSDTAGKSYSYIFYSGSNSNKVITVNLNAGTFTTTDTNFGYIADIYGTVNVKTSACTFSSARMYNSNTVVNKI